MRVRLICMACVLAGLSPATLGWSNKEHIQLTRLTAQRLIEDPATPPQMKSWLMAAMPRRLDEDGERQYLLKQRIGIIPRDADGLAFWATIPDMAALLDGQKKVEPFNVPERSLHFVDLELLMPQEADRVYKPDLSNKPRLADIPREMDDPRWKPAGMLPFRIEQCYAQLVAALREGRLNDLPGQHPRDEHAAKWAGYLAHYIQDGTQPHHATVDYKSRSYFPGRRDAPNVHWDMEGRLVDDEFNDYPQLREELWRALSEALKVAIDPIETDDAWEGTMQVLLISYDALPLIGAAAVEAYREGSFDAEKFFHFRGSYLGREMSVMEMKAHQMAWAVARTQKLWLRAWREWESEAAAGKPAR